MSATLPARSLRPASLPARILPWLGFGALGVLGILAYLASAARYLDVSPATYRNYWPERFWLMAHILGGSIALFSGPSQFWTGLRRRNLALHRTLGKIYLVGVAIGSASGFYLSVVTAPQTSVSFALSLFFLAVAWSTSTAMAFLAVRNRNFEAHQEWMIRSYVVTYGFVVFRLIFGGPLLATVPIPERLAISGWLCWAPPLLFTEIVLQWKRTLAARK